MKFFGLAIGRIVFWLAWPAFWIYYRRGHGRTRVLLYDGDQVAVLKGWINDGRWNLAGGGLHTDEDPLQGALREVREETGLQLQPKDLHELGTQEYIKTGLHFTYMAYAAHISKDSAVFTLQRHEVADIRWVPISQLTEKNTSQEVFYCLRMARERQLLLQ